MKESCLSKLTITESSNRATQYKKIVDALPIYCAELLKADFEPLYLDPDLLSTMFHIKIDTVDPNSAVGTNGSCTPIKETVEKTRVFNKSIQK